MPLKIRDLCVIISILGIAIRHVVEITKALNFIAPILLHPGIILLPDIWLNREMMNSHSPMGFKIRRFELRDLADILSIEKECFEPGIRYDSLTFLYYILAYRDRLLFYVVETEKTIVGYVLATIENKTCHLVSIAVRKQHRGRGIGSTLLDHVIDECRARGAEKIVLEVAVDNKDALNLYLRKGWRIKSVLRKYYGDRDAYFMERQL